MTVILIRNLKIFVFFFSIFKEFYTNILAFSILNKFWIDSILAFIYFSSLSRKQRTPLKYVNSPPMSRPIPAKNINNWKSLSTSHVLSEHDLLVWYEICELETSGEYANRFYFEIFVWNLLIYDLFFQVTYQWLLIIVMTRHVVENFYYIKAFNVELRSLYATNQAQKSYGKMLKKS